MKPSSAPSLSPSSPANKLVHANGDRPPSPSDSRSSVVDNFCIENPAAKGPGGALKKRILRSVREERTDADPLNLVLASATKLVGKKDASKLPCVDEKIAASVEGLADKTKVEDTSSTGSKKGGVKAFPEKLMEILERDDLKHAISWLPHGKAFEIPCPKRFTLEVLPLFFQRSEFSSFTRKLYYWGFRKITKGQDTSAFQHDLFQRGNKELCQQMRAGRVQNAASEKAAKGSKKRKSQNRENVAAKVLLQESPLEVSSAMHSHQVQSKVLVNNVTENRAEQILTLNGNPRAIQIDPCQTNQLLLQGTHQAALYGATLQKQRERLYNEHVAAAQARAKLHEISRMLDLEAAERLRREQELRAAAMLNMGRPAAPYNPQVGLYNTPFPPRWNLNLNGLRR